MKISEIQSHNVSHRIVVPYPVHWSEDDVIATATEKGIQILKSSSSSLSKIMDKMNYSFLNNTVMKMSTFIYLTMISVLISVPSTLCSDITLNVFGSVTNYMPAAFGNFNSDKFTDLFVISTDAKTVKILLGSDTEPLLRENDKLQCTFDGDKSITSVVPGDFNGDGYMDVLVSVLHTSDYNSDDHKDLPSHRNFVHILWGYDEYLNCTIDKHLLVSLGQPLAIDLNQDMIVDLFGINGNINDVENFNKRGFWMFKNGTVLPFRKMNVPEHSSKLKVPHSHAFLDLNHDNYGDLYLTTDDGSAEVWLYNNAERDFIFDHTIDPPPGVDIKHHYIGQTIFQDMALEGKLNIVLPVCFDENCINSTIFIRSTNKDNKSRWHQIKFHYKDWHFVHPNKPKTNKIYLETLTLRAGDFNMDGYPDLLATLTINNNQFQVHLLENKVCDKNCDGFPRKFEVNDNDVLSNNNNSLLGVFYDFYQDGVLDIILVHDTIPKPTVSAFGNSLDYDANFVKVMVLTGLTFDKNPDAFSQLINKKQTVYGTNLPGPTIIYRTTTQEGNPRSAISTQLPQSAHFSLNLPYTIFGLGRTPNFIDDLSVSVYGQKGSWQQLIPNSQMVVIPWPANDSSKWKVQLFVKPSKVIVQSFCALLGTCLLISLIIGGLYWKERKDDHKEKLQEAQRFHFDAM